MNVDSTMCASSGKVAHWDQVDWPKCERQVRRLQARIVKATREGRWHWHPSRRLPPISTPTASDRNAPLRMLSNSASMCWAGETHRSGCWRATLKAALTTSATNGCTIMS